MKTNSTIIEYSITKNWKIEVRGRESSRKPAEPKTIVAAAAGGGSFAVKEGSRQREREIGDEDDCGPRKTV